MTELLRRFFSLNETDLKLSVSIDADKGSEVRPYTLEPSDFVERLSRFKNMSSGSVVSESEPQRYHTPEGLKESK
jgi:hypothetical protein